MIKALKKIVGSQSLKTMFLLLILLLCIYLVMQISLNMIQTQNLSDQNKINITNSIKNIFNTIFFIITSIIAILSYIQAKKTLFNPIRTEIFKLQISEFEKLLMFFQNKTETDFTYTFDFDKILHINAIMMLDDFIDTFYKDEINVNKESRKEMMKDICGAIISQEYAEEFLEAPEYYEKSEKPEKIEITNPALLLKKWQKYKYGKIDYTKKYFENWTIINEFVSSPLIPEDLKIILTEFENIIHNNLSLVGKILTNISQELPEKFPNVKSTKNINLTGFWNKYNHEKQSLEIPAKRVLKYINEYLKVEKLI